jgi:hypothetical protein
MNNKSLIAILAVASIVGGLVGGVAANKLVPMVGGDFAGGVTPSQLFTASASGGAGNGYVTPAGSLGMLASGAIGAGGQSANNALTVIFTGVSVWPTAATTILSSSTPFGSATTTQVSFTASGFSVGDPCEVEYTGTTSTLLTSANVSAVSGNAVTSTVNILNASGASITVTATSTITGVSSTVKTTCFHTGV